MPYSLPSRTPSGPRRRTLLASAAGAALLVGCSSGSEDTEESTGGSPSVVERARARAARDSRGIVERYDAVIAAHPGLAERLGALRAEAVRHVEAFGGSAAATTGPASPSASGSPASPAPSAVPGSEKDAVAGLATAERSLADARAKTLLEVPGELARLLASVAAAGAAHAYLLTEAAK
ncbi:hypothetical protein [Streptomyces sp. S.PB5]|uniref:hypothetical protein n=1 Tax=Streptomyces sp. S.PB5 TaxID=3020844 RepID=UPI0025AF01CC|nr:hypothetical protein [Streptomyces sp. S.PB5]MDN3025243.1 hypothetical protein [Streptomyces sp. S.PB5]